jgi:uncharacterized damage-inducible protein DinB
MIEMLQDLVLHKGFANAALLTVVVQSPAASADAEIVELLHHVLIANRFWASSIVGEPFVADEEVRSPRALPTLVDGFRAVQALEEAWLAHAADADLAKHIAGPLVPGGRCTVAQAITQVCLHSLGHRAQCAKLLRRHGVTPPMTDFIMWIVDRPVAQWPSGSGAPAG